MIFEEWELNLIVDSLESSDNLMNEGVVTKIKTLQSQSRNKRYTFRSTDWLSEAGKKQRGKKKFDYDKGMLNEV